MPTVCVAAAKLVRTTQRDKIHDFRREVEHDVRLSVHCRYRIAIAVAGSRHPAAEYKEWLSETIAKSVIE